MSNFYIHTAMASPAIEGFVNMAITVVEVLISAVVMAMTVTPFVKKTANSRSKGASSKVTF